MELSDQCIVNQQQHYTVKSVLWQKSRLRDDLRPGVV